MSPGQHFIISWVAANSMRLDRKSRVCITLSGMVPDVDGAGYIFDKLVTNLGYQTHYYEAYHHILGHNIFSAFAVSIVFACICGKRLAVFFLSLLTFNLHILCDIAGARGPDGDQWPISYWYPLRPDIQLSWSGQWELSSWINSAVGVSFFIFALIIARYRHVTFFELFSKRVEQEVRKVATQRGFFKT